MAVANGKICCESDKHSSRIRYVYQATGTGDWFRWRIACAEAFGGADDGTYYCLGGVTRGKVYAGSRKDRDEEDASSGFSAAGAYQTYTWYGCNVYAQYRTYNMPASSTHVRAWSMGHVACGVMRIDCLDSGDNSVGYLDFDTGAIGSKVEPSAWYELPATTAKVKIRMANDDGKTIQLIGIDWLNTDSEVDPDAAGSQMMDYTGGNAETVIYGDGWGTGYSAPSTEMAIFWNTDGNAYSADNAVGGLAHRGADAATVTWHTQTTTGALAVWNPSQGDKSAAVDYLVMAITTATAHVETARTTDIGTLTGKLIFSASGVQIEHDVTPGVGNPMDVFYMYTVQCRMPRDVSRIQFQGDETVHQITDSTITSTIKCSGSRCWGGANHVVYDVAMQAVDDDLDYLRHVNAAHHPRVEVIETSMKSYINFYADTGTPYDLAAETSIGTRFEIRLTDASLAGLGSSWTVT